MTSLSLVPGLTVYPSQANFLLVKADNAKSLLESLKESGILIKGFCNWYAIRKFYTHQCCWGKRE